MQIEAHIFFLLSTVTKKIIGKVFLKKGGGDETKYKYERGVYKIGTRGNRQHMDIATYRMNQPSSQFSENQKS